MPAPEKASTEQVVAAARRLLEVGGVGALTVQAVAEQVGVRAPSLYKRVRDRDDLVARALEATVDDLTVTIDRAIVPADGPRERLVAIAHATRSFAERWPVGFGLVFAPAPAARPSTEALAASVAALRAATSELVGDEHALDAARLVTAWMHGFTLMEQTGAFRMGGDVDAAFLYGLDRIVAAIAP